MDDVTQMIGYSTTARHDLVIRKVARSDSRVLVRSFDVDGPRAMVDRFVAVGQRLQAAVPLRVPMDPAVVRLRLSSGFGWYATGTARHFVATIGGRDVGRCSAMLDGGHTDADGLPVGCIGMWECEDGEVGEAGAHALLELATGWLRWEGARRIVGPIDFSTWYGYRFRDGAGDGRDPLLLEPITADHAIAQWERFGFVRDETYFSAEIADPRAVLEMTNPLVKELVGQGWRIRQLRRREWDDLVERAHAMSMAEFVRQPYFTPISLDEFRAMYAPMRDRIDPRFVHTAWTPDGELAGFVLGVRELGAAARALQGGGLTSRIRAAQAAWRADCVMVKTICVAKEHRSSGIALLLQAPLYRTAIDTGHPRVCNMLMHANNRSRLLTDGVGGVEFRSYITLRLDT